MVAHLARNVASAFTALICLSSLFVSVSAYVPATALSLPATATTTAVTSSVTPSKFGQAVTFTATVSTAGLGTPTGSVQFFDGAATIGGAQTLNGAGQAQVTTSTLSVATHTITAQYAGDVPNGFDASSGSLSGGQVVNAANTNIALASTQNPSATGQTIVFTATVTAQSPSTAIVGASGTVTLRRNGSPVCSNIALNVSGQATCSLRFTIAGNYNITTTYNGTGNFNTSNNNASPLVQQALGPTAASVSVSGRVANAVGVGLRGVRVSMTDTDGVVRQAITNAFGYYRFTEVGSGRMYTLTAAAKGQTFQARLISVADTLTDADIVAVPR